MKGKYCGKTDLLDNKRMDKDQSERENQYPDDYYRFEGNYF